MRLAILSYHKNIKIVYPPEWIEQYKQSILNQTYLEFDIFENNYGSGGERIFETSIYQQKEFPTFVHCMNYLLDHIFSLGYDCVANSNVDDFVHSEWVEKSLRYIEKGYDIVSCNFHLLDEGGIYHSHQFDGLDIEKELEKNHNPLCHPGIFYSKAYWERGNRYIPEDIPYEDRELWKKSIKNSKFIIQPEHLVYHRVHDNAVCRSQNR